MGGHKIGNEILLLADAFRDLKETLLKRLVCLDVRLSHFVENCRRAVLRSDLELTADMIFYQLAHELVVLVSHEIVVSDSRAYKNALYALDLAYLPQHPEIFAVIGFERRTRRRRKTFLSHTQALAELLFA